MEFLKTIQIMALYTIRTIVFFVGIIGYFLCFFMALLFERPPVERFWVPIMMLIGIAVLLLSAFWFVHFVHLARLKRLPANALARFFPGFTLENRLWTAVTRTAIGLSLAYWILFLLMHR